LENSFIKRFIKLKFNILPTGRIWYNFWCCLLLIWFDINFDKFLM
jgi:hypothetical protein